MLDSKGFDLWADGYDKEVGLSDDEGSYPFAAYKEVLAYIYRTIMEQDNPVVLDIGFGTGVLTHKLYENGCTIYGQDFSPRMLELSAAKMPDAELYLGDFTKGLVEPLIAQKYDFIVSSYALHHLTDEQKVHFLNSLLENLNENGAILIGDVAFENCTQLLQCRKEAGPEWDEEEIYFVADELQEHFPKLQFIRKSYCSGIITIAR